MRNTKKVKWIGCLIAALVFLWMGYNVAWIIIYPAVNISRTKARISRAGHSAILLGCREMVRGYSTYTNDWIATRADYIELSGASAQHIPSSIRSLEPINIKLYTNRVNIRLHGPPRLFLYGYNDDGDPGDGWVPLTNGLWWYTTGDRHAEKYQANHGLESTSAPPAAGTLETHP